MASAPLNSQREERLVVSFVFPHASCQAFMSRDLFGEQAISDTRDFTRFLEPSVSLLKHEDRVDNGGQPSPMLYVERPDPWDSVPELVKQAEFQPSDTGPRIWALRNEHPNRHVTMTTNPYGEQGAAFCDQLATVHHSLSEHSMDRYASVHKEYDSYRPQCFPSDIGAQDHYVNHDAYSLWAGDQNTSHPYSRSAHNPSGNLSSSRRSHLADAGYVPSLQASSYPSNWSSYQSSGYDFTNILVVRSMD